MKNFKKIEIFALFLMLFSFFSLNIIELNAAEGDIVMVDGASIRTVGTQGLKFSATFDETFLSTLDPTDVRGFFVVYGVATIPQLVAAEPTFMVPINGKAIKSTILYDLTSPTISVVLTGIPFSGYDQSVTVVAFVEIDGVYTYAPTVVTRTVNFVFEAAITDLEDGNTGEYPGNKNTSTISLMLANHGFSGYSLVHNGKVLFFGYNAYISLREMEVGETVLPWTVVQPYTTSETRLDSYGINKDGAIQAGTDGTGALYHNGNATSIVVFSKDLYGYQGGAWGSGTYGVIQVDENGEIVDNIDKNLLGAGVNITLQPGDYLITCFETDRFALGGSASCYNQGADFALGQMVTISYNPELSYGE